MEERYEIRGRIGKGGMGLVYRAFDTRMNREVAIKRILTDSEDENAAKEATRQITKEAGALSSLQHPHIVTIYDVGVDEEGPFVVMELITGKTLDELVETAPLTWVDFRELALQSQEALIAAQDMQLVHRDLKPGNLMLSWLPSGKFQVKIVDFGLAKMSSMPSLQTIDHNDSVYGSIFFMAPEQFERVPLDCRTDMYAMGCVYYYALTCKHPFDGDNGPQVMASHLTHSVTPLAELRPDIPQWAADWVMWHINRAITDRPESARQALQFFLENDQITLQLATASIDLKANDAPAEGANESISPKTKIEAKAKSVTSAVIAQKTGIIKPDGVSSSPPPEETKQADTPQAKIPKPPASTSILNATAAQPIRPPEGSKPSIHLKALTKEAEEKTVEAKPAKDIVSNQSVIRSGNGNQKPAPQLQQVESLRKQVQKPAQNEPAIQTPVTPQSPANQAVNTLEDSAAKTTPQASFFALNKKLIISAVAAIAVIGFVATLNRGPKMTTYLAMETSKSIALNEKDLNNIVKLLDQSNNPTEAQKLVNVLLKAQGKDGAKLPEAIGPILNNKEISTKAKEAIVKGMIPSARLNNKVKSILIDHIANSNDEAGISFISKMPSDEYKSLLPDIYSKTKSSNVKLAILNKLKDSKKLELIMSAAFDSDRQLQEAFLAGLSSFPLADEAFQASLVHYFTKLKSPELRSKYLGLLLSSSSKEESQHIKNLVRAKIYDLVEYVNAPDEQLALIDILSNLVPKNTPGVKKFEQVMQDISNSSSDDRVKAKIIRVLAEKL